MLPWWRRDELLRHLDAGSLFYYDGKSWLVVALTETSINFIKAELTPMGPRYPGLLN